MTMIGADRADSTGVAVIVGVDTHLDFHVAVALDHLAGTWASRACQRPGRITKGS